MANQSRASCPIAVSPSRFAQALLCAVFISVAGCARQATTSTSVATVSAPVAARLAEAGDRLFTVGDVRLRYRDAGEGEPVVFLHGYSRRLDDWFMLADSFRSNYRVIAVDLRGFGQSSKFADPARFGRHMADDVIRLLDHLRIRQAHLVGHSMGALIAANVAARHPTRVASATLVAGPFYSDSAAFAERVKPWVSELERGNGTLLFLQWLFPGIPEPMAVQMSRETMEQNDYGSMIAVMKSLGALSLNRDRVAAAQVPVLITVGTGDPLLDTSRELSNGWPRDRLLEVRGADHGNIIASPDVLSAMRELMRTHAARR